MKPTFAHLLLLTAAISSVNVLHADDTAAPITFRESVVVDANDQVVLEKFIGHAVKYAQSVDPAKNQQTVMEKGIETFAWVEFKSLDCLNTAYELTGDTAYLDLFQEGFQPFLDMTAEFTDGYIGWQGTAIPPRRDKENPDKLVEELQMTFRGIYIMARWVNLARTDADYAAANQATIDTYLNLMENHLFPKWDKRGYFTMLTHAGGVYHGLDYPNLNGMGSLSFEKMSIMVDGLTQLYQATGNPVYLKRALQLGAWYKSNLIIKDDHYEWMSWVPSGPWDINPDKPDAWKVGWMAPDPNAAWYVTSLSIALNLYQLGLLFDDEDMARFITTQKTMCWNGDMENPEFRSVSAATGKYIKGEFFSFQLAPYDATLTEFGFNGYMANKALTKVDSSWAGGVVANDYVMQKFIMLPLVKANAQPFADAGQKFLANDDNRAFYNRLLAFALPTSAEPPTKPSMMFADPQLEIK